MPTSNKQPPEGLLQLIRDSERLLCIAHERPDGDAVGSVLAMTAALQAAGKQATAALSDPVPLKYRFLPGAAEITSSPVGPFDACLIIDCDAPDRVGSLQPVVEAIPRRAVIDHHQPGSELSPADFCDPGAAAAAVLVLRILDALHIPLTAELATCIYTAIATDTGFFRFANTGAETLLDASRCVSAGADPFGIAQRTNDRVPLAHSRLQGQMLRNLELYCDGRVAISHLAPGDFRIAGAEDQHTEHAIDALREIEGVGVSILMKADGNTFWRVSLRSDSLDVAEIARSFGGGGHAAASGCEITGALGQVKQRLLHAVSAAIRRSEAAK